MKTRTRLSTAFVACVALAIRCSPSTPVSPPACRAIDPLAGIGAPPGVVWGFADLHAHPAIEVAFGHKLIWGTALDDAPVNASELPSIAPCPVETHDRVASSPLEREVGAKIFPPLSALGGFAHAPVGSIGSPFSSAWPNARDVIHQQMNVASIRRAYEGGLRLMFASVTDDQAVGALLAGPNVKNGFVPDGEADYESARAQLDLIQQIVERNSTWMGIATDPTMARALIGAGKLALVMSVEMEGLTEQDVDRLYTDYGVRHIVPVHLIDNDIGGTAANGDLFNAASAAASELYRDHHEPNRYMDVVASSDFGRAMGWPVRIGTLSPAPVYADLDSIDYVSYRDLCYEPLASCATETATPSSFIEVGQQNLRGLCRSKEECGMPDYHFGADRIRHFMDKKMIVDVSHMSRRSVTDTLAIDATWPFIASHGDVIHLCNGLANCRETQPSPMTERSLDGAFARTLIGNQGVLGLGTGVGNYRSRAALAARGGPLFHLDSGHASGCVSASGGCAPIVAAETAPTNAPIDTLDITTNGGIDASRQYAQPFVRVVMRSRVADWQYQKHVLVEPLVCSAEGCSLSLPLGMRDELVSPAQVPTAACATPTCGGDIPCGSTGYTIDDVESVSLEWEYLACGASCLSSIGPELVANQCRTTWSNDRAPYWTVNRATVHARLGADVVSQATLVDLARADGAPVSRIGRDRGSLTLYARADRRDTRDARSVPASGHLLKVSLRGAPGNDLAGATPSQAGANVCIAVRRLANGVCAAPVSPPPGSTECPAGWVAFNQRGEWTGDDSVVLYAFARIDGDESSICGLDVAVLDWPAATSAFEIDEARIEVIEDPMMHWVRRYAAISKVAAGERLGTLAIGSDANGLNGMMDISEMGLPDGALTASACGVTQAEAGTASSLAPMRIRNPDGSLGRKVEIDERGLGTYGLFADMIAIIAANPNPCAQDVYQSLMLSAEATLRTWEKITTGITNPTPLPRATHHFDCESP